jgi:predicted DNA-binding transcriptional regulator YafY
MGTEMNRFDRALGILLALRGGEHCSAVELARRFGVSSRTIYRDVDLLSSLGVPVYAERGRGGGIRLMPGYFLPPVMLATGEAMSLLLGLALLGSLRTVPYAADLETARRKLLAALPDGLRSILSDASRLIGFEPMAEDVFHPELSADQDEISTCGFGEGRAVNVFVQALLGGREVLLHYRSPYRATTEEVVATPLGLFWDRDRWYLVGQERGVKQSKLWRADRVVRLSPGAPAEPSQPPFDVRRMLGRAWLLEAMQQWTSETPVTIIVSERQRDRLARDWYYQHAPVEARPDGRFTITLGEDDPAVVFGLLRWLGPGAELIAPLDWRDLFRAELAAMLAAHDPV